MQGGQRPIAILLMAMGGPDSLDHVEPYLLDVRGGRPTPPDLVEEIRERYRVTGGEWPVLGITREVGPEMRHARPGPGDRGDPRDSGLDHWPPCVWGTYGASADRPPE